MNWSKGGLTWPNYRADAKRWRLTKPAFVQGAHTVRILLFMRYKYFFTFRSEYYIDAERMYSTNFLYYIQAPVLQDQTLIPIISKVSVGEDDGTGSDLRLLIDNLGILHVQVLL